MKRRIILTACIILIAGCASTVVETSHSSPISPDWHRYLSSKPRSVAIFPFGGYDSMTRGLATRIESSIRSKLIGWGEYRLVERQYLNRIIGEQDFGLMGITDYNASTLAKMAGADITILGDVTDYTQEEIYVKHEKGQTYSADKYERIVSFSANLRVISVANGQIVHEKGKQFIETSEGYQNVRTYEPKETEDKGKAAIAGLEMLLVGIGGLPKLESYTDLKDKAVTEAIGWFFYDLVTYRKKYRVTYKVVDGNRTLQSRRLLGFVR